MNYYKRHNSVQGREENGTTMPMIDCVGEKTSPKLELEEKDAKGLIGKSEEE